MSLVPELLQSQSLGSCLFPCCCWPSQYEGFRVLNEPGCAKGTNKRMGNDTPVADGCSVVNGRYRYSTTPSHLSTVSLSSTFLLQSKDIQSTTRCIPLSLLACFVLWFFAIRAAHQITASPIPAVAETKFPAAIPQSTSHCSRNIRHNNNNHSTPFPSPQHPNANKQTTTSRVYLCT